MDSKNCVICDENMTSKRTTEISCIRCSKSCCNKCFTTYLMIEPTCMFCKEIISDDFIRKNTTKTFFNNYSKHKRLQMFKREESLLPETQDFAERERRARELEKTLSIFVESKRILKSELNELYYIRDVREVHECNADKKEDKKRKKKEKINELVEINNLIDDTSNAITRLRDFSNLSVAKDDHKLKYVRSCPDNNCRGFLSSAYKCGTCEKYFCSECHVLKNSRDDKTHVCNEDIKASIKMISLDSKPCPKCSCLIYRTEGCSLMWCVKCHTQFDWNTLKIKNGYNHNPEYFRYLRENGKNVPRNPYDNAPNCNDIPGYFMINSVLEPLGIRSYSWDRIYRYRIHVMEMIMTSLPERIDIIDTTRLRIEYLLSDIDKKQWEKLYLMRIKKNEINHERYKVFDMYCNVIKDIFLNLIQNKCIHTFRESCNSIKNYTNEQLEKINEKYGSKDSRWVIERV